MGKIVISENVSLDGEIVVLGSPQLARTLIAHDLANEPVRGAERASDGASLQDKRAAALRRAGIRESA
jgi:hypothetical protein